MKRRIDIVDISAFLHFPAFVLNGRACFGIACSRLCATINTLQWIRQGQGDILGLAHRLRNIDSPFGYHIHLTSIPVYRTDFVRARCLFAGTLYLTDFSISYKFVFLSIGISKHFSFFSSTLNASEYANVLLISAKKESDPVTEDSPFACMPYLTLLPSPARPQSRRNRCTSALSG